jgi:hypothetical protein
VSLALLDIDRQLSKMFAHALQYYRHLQVP